MNPKEHAQDDATEWMLRYLDNALSPAELQSGAHRLKHDPDFRADALATLLDVTQLMEIGQELKLRGALPAAPAPAVSDAPSGNRGFGALLAALRRRWTLAACGAAVALACAAAWIAWTQAAAPRLERVDGQVLVQTASGRRTVARPGTRVPAGAWIYLQPGAAASVHYPREDTWVRLTDGAAVRIESTRSGKRFQLDRGVLSASVAPQPAGAPLRVQGPHLAGRVVGTQFVLSSRETLTQLEVWLGTVQAASLSDPSNALVSAGQLAWAAASGPVQTGSLARGLLEERWTNLPGSDIADLLADPRFPNQPDTRVSLDRAEIPSGQGDSYGVRLRGWVRPPHTGLYRFWIAADDAGELWLSPDETAAAKKRICYTAHDTAPEDWDADPAQASAPIHLVAGHSYYLEALGKQAGGADHLALAWSGPQLQREIITQQFLQHP